jgi:hypothetical protein
MEKRERLISTELKTPPEPAFINDDVDAQTRPLYVREVADAAYAAVFRDRPSYMKCADDNSIPG